MKNNSTGLQAIDIKKLFQEGERFFNENNTSKARVCFERIIAKDPQNIDALNNLGVILFYEGETSHASDLFEKALSIDPTYKDALINLYYMFQSSRQPSSIISYLREAIRLNPRDQELEKLFQEAVSHILNSEKNNLASEMGKIKAFFVLSAGRCGTHTLAKILSLSEKVRLHHYPNPVMGNESIVARRGDVNKSDVLKILFPLISEALKDDLAHGDTTPALTSFADVIAQELPDSKFLVLVRHPYQFVRSALKQNYYQGHPDDSLRLQPSKNSEFYLSWKRLSQIEKICWLWVETYKWILEVISKLNKQRYLIIHFEEIQSGPSKIQEIFEFLNIDGYCEEDVKQILEMSLNSQSYGRFPTPDEWSSEIKNIVNDRCGSLAEQLGYALEMPLVSVPNPAIHSCHRHVPAVSIGFPLYSGGTMLADSLESILSQDFDDFEIIISDHGSDPFVHEIALHYEMLDHRIKYFPTNDRVSCIGVQNFFRVVELSSAPFFIWGSYDDRMEKSYIRKCLEKIQEDDSIALVYTKSKVYQNHTKYLGPGNDSFKADQDDPCERFLHVIWELMMCNAFYGLFRLETLRKTRSFRKDAYAHDNLLLAEVSLMGKIIQLDDQLFIRNLTRNYKYSFEEHYTNIIRSMDPPWLEEGITLPFCRLTYSHCELINYSSLASDKKEQLTSEILRCFRQRWDKQLCYEINRAIRLVNADCFYCTWDGRHYGQEIHNQATHLQHFHVTDVSKALSEALFIYPEWEELKKAYFKCLDTYQELSLK
ncbi:MAG TPA: tetratricopeptide repeat protein [Syntrophales bacterium]|nr:tetratricopeptide repeat protein [Syntrophales bacterium]